MQNDPTASLANDSIRIFVKLVTLIAKTVANEEQLEILQKFVKEKNDAFDKMELQNIDPQTREKEAIEKAMLLTKLDEILNYKLKPFKIKVKRNRLNSWQTDFDPGIVKSWNSKIGRSDSTKINRYLNNIHSEYPVNKSAIDPMSPRRMVSDGINFDFRNDTKSANIPNSFHLYHKQSDPMMLDNTTSELDDYFGVTNY